MLKIAFFLFCSEFDSTIFLPNGSKGMRSSHGIDEILNWPLPLLPGDLKFEKMKNNSSEQLEKRIGSPASQKARQKPITFIKSTRKISLSVRSFWNSVMIFLGGKIRFKKDENFPTFLFLTTCQTPKL